MASIRLDICGIGPRLGVIVNRRSNGPDPLALGCGLRPTQRRREPCEAESAGVEFTNGEQPGVRLTKVAAAHSTVAAKAVRRKTAKATEKKR